MIRRRIVKGYTLIELIIFITIVAISISILIPIASISHRMVTLTPLIKAPQLAQARMDLILAQRQMTGFSSSTDPCTGGSPPTMCTAPSGFTVSANIVSSSSLCSPTTDCKTITVTVSGDGAATLTSLVDDYDP